MRFLVVLAFLCCSLCASASPSKGKGLSFDFDGLPVASVMRVIFVEAYRERPYYLDPAVLQDQRSVSFRYSSRDGDFRPFLEGFLRSLGYAIEQRDGADFVRPIPVSEKPSIAEDPGMEILYYRPRHRDGAYLVEMLSSLFRGKFTSQRAVSSPVGPTSSPASSGGSSEGASLASSSTQPIAPAGSALAQIDRVTDQLIFAGSAKEVTVLKRLLPQVDTDGGKVLVSGLIYEVQTDDHNGSALSLVGSLLSGKLKVSFGSGAGAAADNFVSLQVADMTAIMSALDSDSRFRALSTPKLRVNSGKSGTFSAGGNVPVLGSISYPQGGGTPVQSIEYRPSGLVFSISPVVHDAAIDVHVDQRISSFMITTTGVNGTPTETSRQLTTDVTVSDGEVIVLGGLRQNRSTGSSSGISFLPSWTAAKTADASNTEILLFLQLKRL